MSEQDSPEATTKRRRRQTHTQNGTQSPTLPRPTNDDKDAWRTYWEAQGQVWRTEPEIDEDRQKYLVPPKKVFMATTNPAHKPRK